ncbi:hypothetical protein DFH06DRAFT_1322568 [Mycena polygramma]|nr:hypothetical protein DFH06DRAFT_1322568 [Mycena polygramma]
MPSSSSSTTLILVHLPVDSSDWNLHTRTENVPGRKFPSMLVRLIHTHRTATQPPPMATTPNLASRGPDTPNAPRTQVITPSPRLRRQKLVSRLLLAFFLAQGRQRHTTGPYIPSVLFTWLIWSLEVCTTLVSRFFPSLMFKSSSALHPRYDQLQDIVFNPHETLGRVVRVDSWIVREWYTMLMAVTTAYTCTLTLYCDLLASSSTPLISRLSGDSSDF